MIRIFWSLVFIDPHVVPLCQCVNEANAGNLKGRVRHSPIHLVIRPDVPERGPRPLPRAYALQVADAAVHGVYTRENGACGIDVIKVNVELRLTMGQQLG